jgi:hypothetical protein
MKIISSIYQFGDKLYFVPSSRTTTGLWIETDPITVVDFDSADEVIVNALRSAWSESKTDNPSPTREEFVKRKPVIFKAAKVRSWAAVLREATHCRINHWGDEIGFVPMEKKKRSFDFKYQCSFEIPADSSDAEIAEAIRKTLDLAREG